MPFNYNDTSSSKFTSAGMFLILVVCFAFFILQGCATLPKDYEKPESYALPDTSETWLGLTAANLRANNTDESGILLLSEGVDAMAARVYLARKAQKSIDAQYYMLHGDTVGQIFVSELIKASQRGVRVRLLIDDIDTIGRDLDATKLDMLPNFELRIFNPFIRDRGRGGQVITGFGDITRRMHNKAFVVDNEFAVVGGRNIGNEYFGAESPVSFLDLDGLLIGPVVKEISVEFDTYWNNPVVYPINAISKEKPTNEDLVQTLQEFDELLRAQRYTNFLARVDESEIAQAINSGDIRFEWGQARVLYDSPDKIINTRDKAQYHLRTQIRPEFGGVTEELILVSPYFVPGSDGVKIMASLVKKGVRVRVLTNSLASTDVRIVHAGYSRYRKNLLRAGVELYELKPSSGIDEDKEDKETFDSEKTSLHAKTFILDRKSIFVGSMNLDSRSAFENTEIGILFESEVLARQAAERLDSELLQMAYRLEIYTDKSGNDRILWNSIENGQDVVFTTDPETSFWQRLGYGILGMLPIESEL